MPIAWNKYQQYQKPIGLFITLVALLCGCAAPLPDGSQTSNSDSEGDTGELVTVTAEVQGEEYSATVISGTLYTSKIICNKSGTITADINIAATATLILNDVCTSFSFSPNYALFYDSATSAYYYPVDGANTVTASGQTISLSATSKSISVSNNLIVALYANVTSATVYPKVSTAPTFLFTIGTTAAASSVVSANASVIMPIVGTGNAFSCALVFPSGDKSNGNVYCWGNNTQRIIGTDAVNVSVPKLVIDSKTLNNYGVHNPETYGVPPGAGSINIINSPIALSVGGEFFCVIDSLKKVWCDGSWSANGKIQDEGGADGWIYKIPIAEDVVNVSIGSKFACALTITSKVWCWGTLVNLSGAGTFYDTAKPVEITGASLSYPIKKIAIGDTFLCAIVGSDEHVQCMGDYTLGQLGAKDTTYTLFTESNSYPVVTLSNTPITAVKNITASGNKACATTLTETYCWGNIIGTNLYNSPTFSYYFNILGLYPALTWGSAKECYVDNNGAGHPAANCNVNYASKPLKKKADNSTTENIPQLNAISAGMSSICGIRNDTNQYMCWGVDLVAPNRQQTVYYSFNYHYWFNYVYGTSSRYAGNTNNIIASVTTAGGAYSFGSRFVYSIAVGSNYYNYYDRGAYQQYDFGHICAVLTDASIRCWGGNYFGQVGNSTTDNYITTPYMVLAPTGTALPSGQAASNFY